MSEQERHVYTAEMGFSHKELINGLPTAVKPFAITENGHLNYVLCFEQRRVHLQLSEEHSRTIASITLPVTHISLEFEGFSDEQYHGFLDRFKKYLHRGGG